MLYRIEHDLWGHWGPFIRTRGQWPCRASGQAVYSSEDHYNLLIEFYSLNCICSYILPVSKCPCTVGSDEKFQI